MVHKDIVLVLYLACDGWSFNFLYGAFLGTSSETSQAKPKMISSSFNRKM